MSFIHAIEIRCDVCFHTCPSYRGPRDTIKISQRAMRSASRRMGWTVQKTAEGKIDICKMCSGMAGLPRKYTLRKLKGGVG